MFLSNPLLLPHNMIRNTEKQRIRCKLHVFKTCYAHVINPSSRLSHHACISWSFITSSPGPDDHIFKYILFLVHVEIRFDSCVCRTPRVLPLQSLILLPSGFAFCFSAGWHLSEYRLREFVSKARQYMQLEYEAVVYSCC